MVNLIFFTVGVFTILIGFEGCVFLSDWVKNVPYGKPKRIDDRTTEQLMLPPPWLLFLTISFALAGLVFLALGGM
jgi:hypothetical protein